MHWNAFFALLLGVILGAGGTWLFAIRGPTVLVQGPVGHAKCAGYSKDDWELYPNGMAETPEKAAAIAELTDIFDGKTPGRSVTVSDRGTHWVVFSSPPPGWKGGGYLVTVSRCNAAVRLIEIMM